LWIHNIGKIFLVIAVLTLKMVLIWKYSLSIKESIDSHVISDIHLIGKEGNYFHADIGNSPC